MTKIEKAISSCPLKDGTRDFEDKILGNSIRQDIRIGGYAPFEGRLSSLRALSATLVRGLLRLLPLLAVQERKAIEVGVGVRG